MASISVPPKDSQAGIAAEAASQMTISTSSSESTTLTASTPSRMAIVAMRGLAGTGGDGGGVKNLSELEDVDVISNTPSDNQPLVYSSSLNKWVPGDQPISLDYIEHTTESLLPGGVEDVSLSSPLIFNILAIYSTNPAWVRVYGTSDARAADTRTSPGGIPPAAGTDFYAEVVTTESPQLIRFSPIPMVLTSFGEIFVRVVNMDTVSRELYLNFGILAYGLPIPQD